jgi:predicted O-methyltransferase YrrM
MGGVLACDVSDEFTRIGKPFWQQAGVAHKIDLVLGPALATLDARWPRARPRSYDFAFVDADKATTTATTSAACSWCAPVA